MKHKCQNCNYSGRKNFLSAFLVAFFCVRACVCFVCQHKSHIHLLYKVKKLSEATLWSDRLKSRPHLLINTIMLRRQEEEVLLN